MLRLALLAVIAAALAAADTQPLKLHENLVLQVPASWKVQELPQGSMRLAHLKVVEGAAEAELTVFGNVGGGVEDNFTRWVGQFAADGREQQRSEGKGVHGGWHLLQVTGTFRKPIGPPIAGQTQDAPGSAMLGVILAGPAGPFYLKLTGPKDLVLKQRAALEAAITAR